MKLLYAWFERRVMEVLRKCDEEEKFAASSNQYSSMPSVLHRNIGALAPQYNSSLGGETSRYTLETRPQTLNIWQAHGGWAIEYSHYDNTTDTSVSRMWVVPADQNLGAAIEKIINHELLVK